MGTTVSNTPLESPDLVLDTGFLLDEVKVLTVSENGDVSPVITLGDGETSRPRMGHEYTN